MSLYIKSEKTNQIAKKTRNYRNLHKWVAIPLLIFLFNTGVTGLLLGWKKEAQLLPELQKGITSQPKEWISLKEIDSISKEYWAQQNKKNVFISRIDIRPEMGIAKILYKNNFMELQIDCKTGEILSTSKRNSDFIEKLHDGSIIDYLFKNDKKAFKLGYTTLLSIGLITLSISGFFLWWNPIRMRKKNRGKKD